MKLQAYGHEGAGQSPQSENMLAFLNLSGLIIYTNVIPAEQT